MSHELYSSHPNRDLFYVLKLDCNLLAPVMHGTGNIPHIPDRFTILAGEEFHTEILNSMCGLASDRY